MSIIDQPVFLFSPSTFLNMRIKMIVPSVNKKKHVMKDNSSKLQQYEIKAVKTSNLSVEPQFNIITEN